MQKARGFAVLVGISLLLMAGKAYAIGALFSRPLRSTVTYRQMTIKTVDAEVHIRDGLAVTHVDQVFFNEMCQSVEAVWVFPLPKGAVVTELAYWFNGRRYEGSVREREEAVRDYQDKIRRYLDPALLQYLGDNLFRLNIAPINPRSEVRFEINYVQLLDYEYGVTTYKFLLNATGVSPKPLERVSVSVSAQTRTSFKFFRCPSYEGTTGLNITRISDQEYTLLFGDEDFLPDRDLIVQFETRREGVDIRLFTYTPVPSDSFGSDSFFALTITPPDTLGANRTIPKRVAFVADVSSSMEGERMEQLREALVRFVELLSADDKFNIVVFGTSVQSFAPDFVQASPENVFRAKDFIRRLSAFGLTNMEEALRVALSLSYSPNAANLILFATDGYPTWGKTDPSELLAMVKELNTDSVRIFTFGIGDEVDKSFLKRLATANHGRAFFIEHDAEIAETTTRVFETMSRPVLMNLHLSIPGLVYYDVYPRVLPDLYYGNQVTILGRYINGGRFIVKLTARTNEGAQMLKAPARFETTPGGVRSVAKLWANAKISDLLEQIALYGERPELVNAVVQLSLQFQILTPYTAFYSDPSTGVKREGSERTLPKSFVLYPNSPNPFNAQTQIRFVIPVDLQGQTVTVRIFDLRGRLIKVLYSGPAVPGEHRLVWDGTDAHGQQVASGVYLCVLQVGNKRLQHKMLLLR